VNEASFVASTNTDASGGDAAQNAITNAVNGTDSSRFSSDEPQAVGYSYTVDMGSPQDFNEIEMAVPGSATDYARGYDVNVSDNGTSWTTVDGVGWTDNTAANGLIVNGNNVSAYGLAVEHYQSYEVIWNGQGGKVVFFQNENPYDPPSQSAWEVSSTQLGYPASTFWWHRIGDKRHGCGGQLHQFGAVGRDQLLVNPDRSWARPTTFGPHRGRT